MKQSMRRRFVAVATTLAVSAATLVGAAGRSAAAPAPRPSKPYDAELRAALKDIESFWKATMPKVYSRPFTPLAKGFFAYSSGSVLPRCGDVAIPYRFLAGNAFYCSESDFVAWDDGELFPEIYQKSGSFGLAVVLAHEWGHVVQNRAGLSGFDVQQEQQADCFAGAWTGHVAKGNTAVRYAPGDLEGAMQGFIGFGDRPGYAANLPGAHGNAFDRVAAFQDGFERGAAKCVAYAKAAPPMTEKRYRTVSDLIHQGNASWDEAIPLLKASLNDYWAGQGEANAVVLRSESTDAAQACPSASRLPIDVGLRGIHICRTDNTLRMVVRPMFVLLQKRGDFALGTLMAEAWAKSVQVKNGLTAETEISRRQADCWAGAWAGFAFRGEGANSISLSPGDLDEAVDVLLEGAKKGEPTATFARISAFRKGFFADRQVCG